jgi:endoglucanase
MRRLRRFVLAALSVALLVAVVASPSPAATTTGGNILTSDKAALDKTTGGWAGLSASVTRVSSPHQGGTGSLKVTATPTGPVNIGALSGSTKATLTPATPGTRYTGTAWVRGGTARQAESIVVFYDAAGSIITFAWGPLTTEVAGTFVKLTPAVGVAPLTAAYVATGVIIYAAQTSEVHYVDTASLTATSGTAAAITGPLRTSGNKILDATGRPVVLRGVHRFGLETTAAPKGLNDADIAQIKSWGANFVRLSLAEDLWLSTSCTYDASYASAVDNVVRWTTSRGMIALLDLHFATIAPCGTPGHRMMPDADALTFWSELAARYKANPLVAFDLYNEPHDVSDAVWRDGGTVTDGATTYEAVGMQQLYDVVRSAGATNLVFATGNAWGNTFPSVPLTGTNIVYAAHAYRCPQLDLADCSAVNATDPSLILNNWVTPSATYPVMVTEFGWPDHNDGTYIGNVIAYAEAHGWGWSAFAWDASNGPFALVASVGTPLAQPTPSGMVVLTRLAKNA